MFGLDTINSKLGLIAPSFNTCWGFSKRALLNFNLFLSEDNKRAEGSRDDISISGGASEFALTQKVIVDPLAGKQISKFYLTTFNTNEIKLRIHDDLSGDQFFKLKRLVIHYKIVAEGLEQ